MSIDGPKIFKPLIFNEDASQAEKDEVNQERIAEAISNFNKNKDKPKDEEKDLQFDDTEKDKKTKKVN